MPTDQYGNEVEEDSPHGTGTGTDTVFDPQTFSYLSEALTPGFAGTGGPIDQPPFASSQAPNQIAYGKAQPAIESTRAYMQMLKGMTEPPKSEKVKMPWWGYALGGLSDIGSILSYRHAVKPRNVQIGRSEGGGYVHGRVYPNVGVPQLGGTAAALFGPMTANRRNEDTYQKALALRNRSIMPSVAQFGARAIGGALRPPPPPKTIQPTDFMRNREYLKTVDPKIADLYTREYVTNIHGSAQDKFKLAEERKTRLDEYERTHGKAARRDLERLSGIQPEKPPKPLPGGLSASEKRLIDARVGPIKNQITTLQKTLDALRRSGAGDPDTEQTLQDKIDHLNEAVKYTALGTPGLGRKLMNLDWNDTSQEFESPEETTAESGVEEPPPGFDPHNPDDTDNVPSTSEVPSGTEIGFDPHDPKIRATPMGEGTVGDYLDQLDKMTPEEQQQVGLHIRQALGIR